MADENMKDFVVNWFLLGFLFICLTGTAITFMYNNNPNGLGDSGNIISGVNGNMTSNLLSLPNASNALLNITSNTNPELSQLGSRDSVATSYGAVGTSKGFFEKSKYFISFVFSGTSGQLILGLFGGLFGIVALYYIIKWIRNGI